MVEREIDASHLSNALMRRPFAEAAWYFLAFCEDIAIRDIIKGHDQSHHEIAATADNLIVHAEWPLRWLTRSCPPGGSVPRTFDDEKYEAAWKLSNLGMDYLAFEAAFTWASYGLLTLRLEGKRILTSGPMRNDNRFDAYDRLTQEMTVPSMEAGDVAFMDRVASSVRVRGNAFTYPMSPKIMSDAMQSVGRALNERFVLPVDWAFPKFTLREFGEVARVLWTLSLIHFQARVVAAKLGCPGLGIASALLLMEKPDLVNQVRRYSGLDDAVVKDILEVLTYGSSGQVDPDPALQPIIPLAKSTLAIAPNIVLNSSLERNLAVLLNRFPDERKIYSSLNFERENLSRNKLEAGLAGLGLRFWSGNVPEWSRHSEIDLAIISDADRCCLLLEIKSFIAPAEPREVRDRSDEIRNGIAQLQRRQELASEVPEPLLRVLKIDKTFEREWAVVSDSSIGAAYVQSPLVPVVNLRHLLAKLRRGGLRRCCEWLKARDYLPIEGVHFQTVNVEESIGEWIVEWYGLRGLTDDYVTHR